MKFFSYEKYQFVPIVINLRNFYNNKLFCTEYQIFHVKIKCLHFLIYKLKKIINFYIVKINNNI